MTTDFQLTDIQELLGNPMADAVGMTVDEARAIIEKAIAAIHADKKLAPKVAFETETLRALAVLESSDLALFHGTLNTFQDAKIGKRDLKDAVKAKRPKLHIVGAEDALTHNTAASFLSDAPLPDLVIPQNYRLSATETSLEGFGANGPTLKTIAHGAILIGGRTTDIESNAECTLLTYRQNGHYYNRLVDRGQIANSKRIVDLAETGYPVTTNQAGDQIDYLAQLEAANIEMLPHAQTTNHLGWQGENGKMGFLVGQTLIKQDGKSITNAPLSTVEQWQADSIYFRGGSDGEEQAISGFKQAGTMKQWQAAIQEIKGYKVPMTLLYASFTPPMLEIYGCSNFAIETHGASGKGKTTSLIVAASVWGKSEERAPDAIMKGWDDTKVFLERVAAAMNHLPLIINDTKKAKKPEDISNVIYQVESGRGRGRGTRGGLAMTRTWTTVLISSGEQPITSFCENAGVKNRVIEIDDPPFNGDNAALVTSLKFNLMDNYGHAGPAFISWVCGNMDKRGEWRKRYKELTLIYTRAARTEQANRLASYAAAITLTGELVHESGVLPWAFNNTVEELWGGIAAVAQDLLGAERALTKLVNHALANQFHFAGREEDARTEIWGKWERGEDFEYISFYPQVVEKYLSNAGFPHIESIYGEWQDRGWLNVDKDRKYYKKVRLSTGNTPRMIVVNRVGLQHIGIVEKPDGMPPAKPEWTGKTMQEVDENDIKF